VLHDQLSLRVSHVAAAKVVRSFAQALDGSVGTHDQDGAGLQQRLPDAHDVVEAEDAGQEVDLPLDEHVCGTPAGFLARPKNS